MNMDVVEVKQSNNKCVTKAPRKTKGHRFSRKCASLVKEQRARIYILRRCATMLLCWYIQGDEY